MMVVLSGQVLGGPVVVGQGPDVTAEGYKEGQRVQVVTECGVVKRCVTLGVAEVWISPRETIEKRNYVLGNTFYFNIRRTVLFRIMVEITDHELMIFKGKVIPLFLGPFDCFI